VRLRPGRARERLHGAVANQRLTGILLVGGASARFGSPKALASLDGRTLAEIAWETLAFCDERLALGKREDALDLPFDLVDDGSEVRAPLAGVVAGLTAASHELCVVLPVDTPRVTGDDLRALAEACRDAAVPQSGPLPGAYRKAARIHLARCLADGRLSLRDALSELDVAVVQIDPRALLNVNVPDDLRSVA
jgi:molybdopterin-guanine dinucleotide biosynthesis protein A